MSASTHFLGTAVAQSVLERGGNAFDAVVAAAFVLHIVEPHLNGPGGDLVAIARPAGQAPTVLVGQGAAPAAASVAAYRAMGLVSVPGSGALAAAVPGAVPAWLQLLRDHGTWEISDALAYAIECAEGGHRISASAAGVIAAMVPHFAHHWPTSAALWLSDGSAPREGSVITNLPYALTLRRLLSSARTAGSREERIDAVAREWRTGFVAHDAVEFLRRPHRHSDGRDHVGVIAVEDFAAHAPTTEVPLSVRFRGVDVMKAGPWSQGPVLLQSLLILDCLDDASIDPATVDGVHTIVEALKLAMADRDAYYGHAAGPANQAVMRHLLSRTYAQQRAQQISARASSEFRPGDVPGFSPFTPPLLNPTDLDPSTGEPTVQASGSTRGDTVHIDVVDRAGNIVSATPSGGWLQSSPAIPSLGFCLGTRLQMTWLDERSPSALIPGRRPRTTLSPTLLHDGDEFAALGTPGGDQQDQWQLLYLLRTIAGGFSPQEAIDAPAFHTTSIVSSFWPRTFAPAGLIMESRTDGAVVDGLRARGHVVTLTAPWSLGRLSTAGQLPADQVFAAANPRGGLGYAAGR